MHHLGRLIPICMSPLMFLASKQQTYVFIRQFQIILVLTVCFIYVSRITMASFIINIQLGPSLHRGVGIPTRLLLGNMYQYDI